MLASAAILSLGQLALAADPEIKLSGGTGTETDPYLISKAADLVELAEACNGKTAAASGHYSKQYFKITADIDMKDVKDFLGIGCAPAGVSGSSSWYFGGIVDGGGHKISNMTISGVKFDDNGKALAASATNSRNYTALFGCVDNTFQLKDLTIDETCHVEGYNYVSGVVGYARSGSYNTTEKKGYSVVLENVTNLASIDCYNNYAAGLCAYGYGYNSTTNGHFPITFKYCVNGGNIRVLNTYAAGLGYTQYGLYENCVNYGNIHGYKFNDLASKNQANYLAGIDAFGDYGVFNNVANYGTVKAENESTSDNNFYIGGICRELYGSSTFRMKMNSVVNYGPLIYPSRCSTYVGAIAGKDNVNVELTNVYYDAQVWGNRAVAGKPREGITGANTTDLTSGILGGFDATYWNTEQGFYPTLKVAMSPYIRTVSGTYPVFESVQDGCMGFQGTIKASTRVPDVKLATTTEGFKVVDNELTVDASIKTPLSGNLTVSCDDYVMPLKIAYMPKIWDGEGTDARPYLIKTAQDLVNLQNLCNDPTLKMHYEGVYFHQANDIDMAGVEFQGIGSVHTGNTSSKEQYYFAGTFDGGNHKISNLKINRTTVVDGKYPTSVSNGLQYFVGLFGTLGTGGKITGVNLDATCEINGNCYTGSIVGHAYDKTTVSNCTSAAKVFASDGYVGGIVGFSEVPSGADVTQVIENCVFLGSVKACYQNAGGIIGWSKGEVRNCANYGDVTLLIDQYTSTGRKLDALYHAGGIAGYSYGNVRNSLNAGTITAPGGRAAGIVGETYIGSKKGAVTGCVNYGVVIVSEDKTTAGAIVGKNNGKFMSQANYYDAQLCEYPASADNSAAVNFGFNGLTTAQFTSGEKLDSIDDGLLIYRKGYYPMPAALAELPLVKESAGMYVTFPAGTNVLDVKEEGVISTYMNGVTTSLEVPGSGFDLKDGKLVPLPVKEITANTLTFKGKYTSRPYFIQRLAPVLPGEGTKESPYIIANAADFNKIGTYIVKTKDSLSGKYFSITADLDFTGAEVAEGDFKGLVLNPVGNSITSFDGIVLGNNKTIRNLNFAKDDDYSTQKTSVAMFAYTGPNFKISDLTFDNDTINAYNNTAMVVVNLYGTVENITINKTCQVNGIKQNSNYGNYTGAIAARAYAGAKIINCVNNADVTGMNYTGSMVGCGPNTGEELLIIDKCTNTGTIRSNSDRTAAGPSSYSYPTAYTGGISGGGAARITNCVNKGDVLSFFNNTVKYEMGQYMGGIAGGINGTKRNDDLKLSAGIFNCENYGKVTGYQKVGGIVGSTVNTATTKDSIEVSNNVNYGDVVAYSYAGGVVGQTTICDKYFNDANHGNVSIMQGDAGGIAGCISAKDAQMAGCYNTGDINCANYAAGIVGMVSGTSFTFEIDRCFNTGNVWVTDSVANASSLNGTVGGLINCQGGATNSYSTGNVTGPNTVGGLSSSLYKDAKFTNCYTTGKVALSTGAAETTKIGNIFGGLASGVDPFNAETPKFSNVYFLKRNGGKTYENDKAVGITGVNSEDMFKANLGDKFVKNASCFQMIAGMDTIAAAKANAAYYTLDEFDSEGDIFEPIVLGQLPGVVWTGENFEIAGGKAFGKKLGKATLTATCGQFSKTYEFIIQQVSSAGDVVVEDNEAKAEYYNLQGIRVATPQAGQIYILKRGTTTRKVLVK